MGKAQLTRALQAVALAVAIALAIGLYKAKTDAARTQSHVRALQAEISERESDLRALRAEIARQESPANVEALAQDRLGLVAAGQSAALPEAAIEQRLPAPERSESK